MLFSVFMNYVLGGFCWLCCFLLGFGFVLVLVACDITVWLWLFVWFEVFGLLASGVWIICASF